MGTVSIFLQSVGGAAISGATLGNGNKCHAVFEANKTLLSHPDKIYPDQVLRIPQDAYSPRRDLPSSFRFTEYQQGVSGRPCFRLWMAIVVDPSYDLIQELCEQVQVDTYTGGDFADKASTE